MWPVDLRAACYTKEERPQGRGYSGYSSIFTASVGENSLALRLLFLAKFLKSGITAKKRETLVYFLGFFPPKFVYLFFLLFYFLFFFLVFESRIAAQRIPARIDPKMGRCNGQWVVGQAAI